MNWVAVQLAAFRQFHDLAQVHHCHPVADVFHHGQVMGNKQVGEPQFLLQFFQQVDHLGLDGHVQRGNRFVTDDKLRLHGQGPGNADTLALAAAELVGKSGSMLGVESHQFQQVVNAFATFFSLGKLMDIQGFTNDVADGHPGIQGSVRVLKNHLHAAVQLGRFLAFQVINVLTLKKDPASCRLIKPDNGPSHRGLAAAALTHQAQSLALLHFKGYTVNCLQVTLGLEHSSGHREIFL